ncbi:glycerate kinase [Chloroflexota bacterium]
MEMRIQNRKTLVSHGNTQGRKALLDILEAGLQASDPYHNTRKLIRLDKDELIIGGNEYEPHGTLKPGDIVFNLSQIGNIYVFGAGKGIQRVAKAIEDLLGDRLTGGHVIDKKGYPIILKKIGVTLGGHPVPDEDCVKGCQRILEMTRGLSEQDLVFTCVGNGVSSLLTMPVPDVSLDDVRRTVSIMQIERGAPTSDLTAIRNHIDMVKGGKISRHIHPAKAIHVLALHPGNHHQLMHRNSWLHTLPDCTTFQLAVDNLKKWDAWEAVPTTVREYLEKADPEHETVKAEEFDKMSFRIFGVMPGYNQSAKLPAAIKKAEELGFKPVVLTDDLMWIEASQASIYLSAIARTSERTGYPFKPPCAIFTNGEMVVTVGKEKGIGGRNQEFVLTAATRIAGSENILIASVDTDGTDGPGTQFIKGSENMPCLAGGIVDGYTVAEAEKAGVNIIEALKRHNTTPALLELKSGMVAAPNISLNDLTVALIMRRG